MEEFEDAMRRELEGFVVDEQFELFTVDATKIGGDIYRFAGKPVIDSNGDRVHPFFGGIEFVVLPMESKGWDWSAGGTLPQPTVRFLLAREDGDQSSIVSALMSLVEVYDDLLGATVTRVQTLRKFLDDGDDPNPQAHMGIEVYTIAQKTGQNDEMIEFKLQSALDLEDVQLPRRQVLNYCQWTYRRALADGTFDYTNVSCPYVGNAFFDQSGNPVSSPQEDRCSRLLTTGCKRRYGANAKLPFGGFPGAGKIGV